jgi:alkanesulfonate monooxygenase SsuD/methylene tetrahydromethanopterin reductase-like flavin-dependent oxidoreductase (luciferase family)
MKVPRNSAAYFWNIFMQVPFSSLLLHRLGPGRRRRRFARIQGSGAHYAIGSAAATEAFLSLPKGRAIMSGAAATKGRPAVTAFYYFCGHEQWQPETLVDHAVAAETAGFDGLLVSDHFHPWVDDAGASGYAFSTLGAIAHATHRVRLATGVTTPLFRHHPAVVAQAAATLDRLSGGRFDLGVGTGENINEGPLGLPFPPYRERARRLGEALEIMRRLLDGEKLTFSGRYYQTDRAHLYSPPLGRVPIWMAAGGPRSVW